MPLLRPPLKPQQGVLQNSMGINFYKRSSGKGLSKSLLPPPENTDLIYKGYQAKMACGGLRGMIRSNWLSKGMKVTFDSSTSALMCQVRVSKDLPGTAQGNGHLGPARRDRSIFPPLP